MIVEYDCVVCGDHVRISRSPSTMKTPPKYCSQRCNGLARTGTGSGPTPNHTFNCQQCGVEVRTYRSPSALPPKYCGLKCIGEAQRGESNPAYTGGRHKDAAGYVLIFAPDHPDAYETGYILEHRMVAAKSIGRRLDDEEVVHHINRIKDDNRPENLMVLPNQSEHLKLHRRERALA